MKPKILIAIPMLNTVRAEFFQSIMGLQGVGEAKLALEVDSLTHMARNHLALKAINGNYDYIFWLDSDVVFEPDLLVNLYEDISEGHDYVTALYFKRVLPTAPVICKELVYEKDEKTGITTHKAEFYNDYPKDSLFPVAASGLGACLMRTEIVKKVAESLKCAPFDPLPHLGEDFSFCHRLTQLGIEMVCDSSLKLGHVGTMIYHEGIFEQQDEEEA